MPYVLKDLVRHAAAHPATFQIPSRQLRETLAVGSSAKLVFVPSPSVKGGGHERLWVEITAREGEEYIGRLERDPMFIDAIGVRKGDTVRFRACHVASI
jgi:hypothetical protein